MPYNSLWGGEDGAIEIWDFMLSKGDKKQKFYILKSNVATGHARQRRESGHLYNGLYPQDHSVKIGLYFPCKYKQTAHALASAPKMD